MRVAVTACSPNLKKQQSSHTSTTQTINLSLAARNRINLSHIHLDSSVEKVPEPEAHKVTKFKLTLGLSLCLIRARGFALVGVGLGYPKSTLNAGKGSLTQAQGELELGTRKKYEDFCKKLNARNSAKFFRARHASSLVTTPGRGPWSRAAVPRQSQVSFQSVGVRARVKALNRGRLFHAKI